MSPIKIGQTKPLTKDEENLVRDQTREKLRAYAAYAVAVQRRNAQAAKRKEEIDRRLAEDNASDQAAMVLLASDLDVVAKLHRTILFVGKRSFDADTATLSLQKKSEVIINDQEAAIQFAAVNGYADLVKSETKLVKPAIKTRMQSGEEIPGVTLLESENVNIKIRDDLDANPTPE
jgi:hypothetical protein